MNSILQTVQQLTLFGVIVGLGIVFWLMLTMCEPYGMGDFVYKSFASQSSYFTGLGVTAGGMTLLLVILDVFYWKGVFRYLARFLVAVNFVLYFLTALAGTQRFPSAPVAVYFTVCPIILYALKSTLMRNMDPLSFLAAVGGSLLFVSIVSLGVFIAYAFGYNNFWSETVRLDFYVRLDCIPQNATIPTSNMTELTAFLDAMDVASLCDEAFLSWISPIILVLFTFAMGGAVLLIVHSQRAYSKGQNKMDLQVRAFLTFLLLGFLALWCAAGIGGADVGLSSVVFTFSFLMMVIGCSAIVFVEGLESFSSEVKQQPLVARVMGWTKSDWMRSLLLVLFFPLFFVIVPLSFLNQLGRRVLPITKPFKDDAERKLWLSVELSRRLQAMKLWHWTSVLCKAIWWGVIFFSLSVIGARFINVFFSWLQDVLETNGVGILGASLIFIVVGWLCFMLPPIPGVPVYIACSVIIVPVCMREGWDFWVSWIFCSFIALVMRLLAVAGEQVMIGQWFGSNSVAVRRAVGVNSVEIRAIKKILLTKGLTRAKVACLVGGPDWPMCVTAGILRTSLAQNLLGSLPVFFVIFPVTLAGALILKRSEGGVWASAATMALALTGLIQTIMLGAAAFFIEQTVQLHREELKSWPDDEEVKKFDEISNKRARVRSYASQWVRLPTWLKLLIIAGVVAETASAYIFQLFGSRCFLAFDITDDIALVLNNNVLNIVKPLGWVGIGLFAFGCVVLIVLGRWISFTTRGGFTIPEDEEERLRRLSDAGLDDQPEDEDIGINNDGKPVVAPMRSPTSQSRV